jgi:hypothetical protein
VLCFSTAATNQARRFPRLPRTLAVRLKRDRCDRIAPQPFLHPPSHPLLTMYKLSSLFSSRPSWLEAFYEILAASTGHGGILMPDTIVMQYHKMSAAFASGRDLSVQKTDLVRGGRMTTKV